MSAKTACARVYTSIRPVQELLRADLPGIHLEGQLQVPLDTFYPERAEDETSNR